MSPGSLHGKVERQGDEGPRSGVGRAWEEGHVAQPHGLMGCD